MTITPLPTSKISVEASDLAGPVIVVPQSSKPLRYFLGLFIVTWLVVFIGGMISTFDFRKLDLDSQALPLVWIAVWTIFAIYLAFRMLRPTTPESLRLLKTGIGFDSGIRPPPLGFNPRGFTFDLPAFFRGRRRFEISLDQLRSLRLREFDTGNRLTVDVGTERLEIANAASDVEREWLACVLADRYNLPRSVVGCSA